ncbi:MAG: HipA domain-containing protein [Candidatus Halichondribacter symbioticus]
MSKYKFIDLSQVINIDGWEIDSTDPGGSRSKKTVYKQGTKKLYIFKEPKKGQEAQIWSELIASYIAGDLLGWDVQHSTIAKTKDTLTGRDRVGNLLGYIYGKSDIFRHGEVFCSLMDSNYDVKVGERHTWHLINRICEMLDFTEKRLTNNKFIREDYIRFWGRAIAFDTLISNTDRHAQNWSIIVKNRSPVVKDRPFIKGLLTMLQKSDTEKKSDITLEMSPLYDNATSMGCDYDAKGLTKWFQNGKMNPDKLAKHIKKGCHHLRDENGKRFPFETLCQRVLSEQPQTRAEFESVATLDLSKLNPILNDIMAMKDLPAEAMLSPQQAEVIMALLQAGQNRVKNSLKNAKQ